MSPNITQQSTFPESNSEEFTAPRTPTRKSNKKKDPLLKAVDALEKVTSHHFSNIDNDEFDLFGQTIAQQLRQLPLVIALETEETILSVIRRQRTRVLTQSSSSRNPLTSTPEYMGSNKNLPEEHPVYQSASSSESESVASTSGAINNYTTDPYSMGYNNDILSQAIASISDREIDFNDY
ncbi:hypothetical protein ACJJTC_009606 [Scirpophaga incertulas]